MDGGRVPVCGEAVQHDSVLRDPLGERERPGADRVQRDVLALLGDRLGGEHHAGAVGEEGGERGVGGGEVDARGEGVDDLHLGHGLQLGAAEAALHRLGAFEVGLDRRGVERGSVLEFDAGAQVQGEGVVVGRPFPAGGELRDEVEVRVGVDELVAEGGEDVAVDVVAALRRVERAGVAGERDCQGGSAG